MFDVGNGDLKVADELANALSLERDAVRATESQLSDRLGEVFQEHGLPVDQSEAWDDFDHMFLTPLLARSGAHVYELLAEGFADGTDASKTYGELLRPLYDKYGPEVREALAAFLDPSDRNVRQYVLRRLNGQFAREAASLDDDTLAKIARETDKKLRLRLLLDTNFAFTVLELHDNPGNDVGADLLRLIAEVRDHVDVELYVLSITIDEIRRVLRDVIARFTELVPSRTVATAAQPLRSSGLLRKFLDAASRATTRTLTANAFFAPYEENTLMFLREKDVELYNESVDALRTDQSVVDDLHDQEDVQRRIRPRGSKGYDANLHDMVLWHFVDRKRPTTVESPIDAGFWIVTLDYGLVAFDRHKHRGKSTPASCVTPADLIHLLQFWVPRNEILDKALVGAIREPLLFLEFDRAAEAVTLQILAELSRFESVDDLSPELIQRVILQKGLRARLGAPVQADGPSRAELIESAVVEEARRLEEELGVLRAERQTAESRALEASAQGSLEVAGVNARLEAKSTELEGAHDAIAQLEKQVDEEKTASAQALASLRDDHNELRGQLAQAKAERRQTVEAIAFGIAALVLAAIVVVALGFALRHTFRREWIDWLGVAVLGVLAWLVGLELFTERRDQIRKSSIMQLLKRSRRGLIAAIVAVMLGLLVTAVWAAQVDAPVKTPTPHTNTTTT